MLKCKYQIIYLFDYQSDSLPYKVTEQANKKQKKR